MKKTTGFVFGLILGSQLSMAATESSGSKRSALDILQMSVESRNQALKEITPQQLSDLGEIAFSNKHAMQTRWSAIVSLSETDLDKSMPLLLKASEDKEWFMRNAALVALTNARSAKAEPVARKLLKDKALVVRSAAVDVLQKNLSSQNRDTLWAELDQDYNFKNGQSLWVRSQIVAALAGNPDSSEKKVFGSLLKDKDNSVREAAITGLEKITGMQFGTQSTKLDKKIALWNDYLNKDRAN